MEACAPRFVSENHSKHDRCKHKAAHPFGPAEDAVAPAPLRGLLHGRPGPGRAKTRHRAVTARNPGYPAATRGMGLACNPWVSDHGTYASGLRTAGGRTRCRVPQVAGGAFPRGAAGLHRCLQE